MSFIWHSAQDQLYTPTPIGANRGPSRSHPDVAVLNRRIAVLEQTLKGARDHAFTARTGPLAPTYDLTLCSTPVWTCCSLQNAQR